MEKRSADILTAVVREFIESGEPVSSDFLFKHYGFGIKPAMIRWELNELTDQGFLEQPHHAAGRIPSDRGYEHFAGEVLMAERARLHREFDRFLMRGAWQDLIGGLSEELGAVGAALRLRDGLIFKGFLENLVDNLEWDSRDELKTILRDFDEIESRSEALSRTKESDFLKIFIGRSPITRSNSLSVVMGDYEIDGQQILLCAIGPKRMDYEKAIALFKGLKEHHKPHTNHDRR